MGPTSKTKTKTNLETRKANLVDRDEISEVGSNKWKQSIGAGERVYFAENAQLCQIVIENLGPDTVALSSSFGPQVDLGPGKLRIWDAYGVIAVASTGQKSAVVVMQCTPRSKLK
jgi:hypothetical protein